MDVVKNILVKGFVLFAGVTAVYLFARAKNMSLVQSQTFAFSAWIFGHVFLAFVSRSEKEPILSMGIFSNRIIALWAIAAVIFLTAAVYIPFLGSRLNLEAIGFGYFVSIALVMAIIIGSLEIRKYHEKIG